MVVEKHQTRGYLRAIPGLPLERQRQMARDAGCHYTYEHGEKAGQRSARAAWLASLRADDTAWLASVLCLLLPPRERADDYSPTADLSATTNHILATGAVLVDARGRATSAEPGKWAQHMLVETKRAAQGERSQAAIKRSLDAARVAAGPGIKARWHAPAMAAELERQTAIWTGAGPIDRVRKHLHAELAGCSTRTLYDVLGRRRPDDPGAGGRGKIRGSR